MQKFVDRPKAAGTLLLAALLALPALPAAVSGQTLPTPRQFVDNLDLRCYAIPDQAPLGINLRLDHLNPYLISQRLPVENVTLAQPLDLCVPVYKNNSPPPGNVLPFIQWLDWKCYGISGPDLKLPLTLTHLNPVITGIVGPTTVVTVHEPEELCVPVLKSTTSQPTPPPPAVQALVEWIDVKCYGVETTQVVDSPITLTHLNPLFAKMPAEVTTLGNPTQLCVPVKKNLTAPPDSVLPIVEYSDTLCFDLVGKPLDQTLWLTHLNPVLLGLKAPQENVFIGETTKLCVPVAKNGNFPPGSP